MRTRTMLLLSLALVLPAGCGSPDPDRSAPPVASLQDPSSAPPATGRPSPAQVAPVIRPDTTSAEVRRMQQPWIKCLQKRGVPTRIQPEDGLLDLDATGNSAETNGRLVADRPEHVQACGKLAPVLAPELDEDKNPYFADDDDNYHKCLVAAGSDLVKRNGEWVPGPTWNDQPADEARDLRCQAEAFDGVKG